MFRRLRINTQERAISVDINRLQSMAARGFNETMRHMLLIGTSEPNLSLYADSVSATAPVTHEILRGLCVRPAVGSWNLSVDSGVIFIIDPSAAGYEDSVAIPLRSPGVSLLGALFITPNSSGQTRFDVIECRVSTTPATVTDNRDIFDPATGLFSAVAIVKEIEQQLEFRVRAGTPGAGFPGASTGWAPLCVALVPNGATSNDQCTFWDVRRLAEDHVAAPFDVSMAPQFGSLDGLLDRVSATSWVFTGSFTGAFEGRRVGGKLRRGTPGTDAESVDFFMTGNKDAAYAEPLSTTTNYYAYLLFPFGLPRWSRYTDASTAVRAPREPRGIPVLTQVAPNPDGTPSSPISLANIFGTGTTSAGLFVLMTRNNASIGPNYLSNIWAGARSQTQGFGTIGASSVIVGALGFGGDTGNASFTIPAGRVPQNAKAMHCAIALQGNLPNGTYVNLFFNVRVSANGTVSTTPTSRDGDWCGNGQTFIANGSNFSFSSPTMRLPLPPSVAGAPRVDPLVLNLYWGTQTMTSVSLSIQGFDF